jgi:hypothetical protein
MGLDCLFEKDLAKVRFGNKMLEVSLSLVRICQRSHIGVSLENPRRSRIWWTPPMLRALHRGSKVVVDFCTYGTPWQKATVFAVWNGHFLESLGQTCHRVGNMCSTSGLPHVRLQGTLPGGKNMTLVAEPYPIQLCADFAKLVTQAVETQTFRHLYLPWAH